MIKTIVMDDDIDDKPTLVLNNVAIRIQDFGTRVLVFLQSPDREAVIQRYYSFWNHGATGGELEWWSDNCGFFWIFGTVTETAERKLESAMAHAAEMEVYQGGGEIGLGRALTIARARLAQVSWVTWYKITEVWDGGFDMGTSVSAEKSTGNFDDDVLGVTIEKSQTHIGETS